VELASPLRVGARRVDACIRRRWRGAAAAGLQQLPADGGGNCSPVPGVAVDSHSMHPLQPARPTGIWSQVSSIGVVAGPSEPLSSTRPSFTRRPNGLHHVLSEWVVAARPPESIQRRTTSHRRLSSEYAARHCECVAQLVSTTVQGAHEGEAVARMSTSPRRITLPSADSSTVPRSACRLAQIEHDGPSAPARLPMLFGTWQKARQPTDEVLMSVLPPHRLGGVIVSLEISAVPPEGGVACRRRPQSGDGAPAMLRSSWSRYHFHRAHCSAPHLRQLFERAAV